MDQILINKYGNRKLNIENKASNFKIRWKKQIESGGLKKKKNRRCNETSPETRAPSLSLSSPRFRPHPRPLLRKNYRTVALGRRGRPLNRWKRRGHVANVGMMKCEPDYGVLGVRKIHCITLPHRSIRGALRSPPFIRRNTIAHRGQPDPVVSG